MTTLYEESQRGSNLYWEWKRERESQARFESGHNKNIDWQLADVEWRAAIEAAETEEEKNRIRFAGPQAFFGKLKLRTPR